MSDTIPAADPLPELIADLIRVGVSCLVSEATGPRLVYDDADPRAVAVARRAAPLLAGRRAEAVALFAEGGAVHLADASGVSYPLATVCGTCRAAVFLDHPGNVADVFQVCGRKRFVYWEQFEQGGRPRKHLTAGCPWEPRHPEVPVPPTGWPKGTGE